MIKGEQMWTTANGNPKHSMLCIDTFGISTKTKITMYKTIHVPTLLYGAENWVLRR